MGYFSLTCSPGRNPTRLEGAEASVSASGEEIDISAKLTEARDTIALASGKIHSPSFLRNRDISIRMVLLKLETGPGWGQFKTNYLRREITREVRKRRPQWIAGSAECHKTEPASASFALSANWKSYPESD